MGHSGGPLYYCPGDPDVELCDDDDKGWGVAVVAGFSAFNRWNGPRGAYFRDWAVTIMDTH